MTIDHASLLAAARDLLQRPDRAIAGVWPRASALLARQALESALDAYWQTRAPQEARACAEASTHAQLLCLRRYLGDDGLAGRLAWAWTGLSRACHHHAYDMPPSATELTGWMEVVEEFAGCQPFGTATPGESSPASAASVRLPPR